MRQSTTPHRLTLAQDRAVAVAVRASVGALVQAKTDAVARASGRVWAARAQHQPRCNSNSSPALAVQQKCKLWVVVNVHPAIRSSVVQMAR